MPSGAKSRVLLAAAALAGVPLLAGGHSTLALWSDSAVVPGTTISTVAVTAPQVSCGAIGLDTVSVTWQPVPDATGYRVYLVGQQTPLELPAGTTSTTLAVAGTVTVTARFGPWESGPSAAKTVTLVPVPGCS